MAKNFLAMCQYLEGLGKSYASKLLAPSKLKCSTHTFIQQPVDGYSAKTHHTAKCFLRQHSVHNARSLNRYSITAMNSQYLGAGMTRRLLHSLPVPVCTESHKSFLVFRQLKRPVATLNFQDPVHLPTVLFLDASEASSFCV